MELCGMKCLLIQTAFIGDVVLATPLVEKLHRFFPGARIDMLVRKGNEKLLDQHPHLNQVLVWDKKQRKYASLFQLLRAIRRERYDLLVNCQRFAASGILTAFSGAAQTVGFDKNPFSFLFSRSIAHQIGDGRHEVQRNLDLIRHLTDDTIERPRLYPSRADYGYAQELAGNQTYFCLAPTSVWFTKQLPARQWVKLIALLPADARVFLLGGPGDREACEAIARAADRPNIVNTAGQLSFLQSAALMQGARRNFVNDSAPLHFASAVNAPVTAFFCSTVPAFGFTPLSDDSLVVETTRQLDCRPCGLHGFKACPKGYFDCAESLDVFAAFPKQPAA